MMGNYSAYASYKDSRVEWLGDIPEHWRRSVFRYYYDIQLGKMLQNESQSEDDIEISYLKAIHVRWDKVDIDDLPKMWASPKDKKKYSVRNGDLLISEGGEVGRTTLLKNLEEDCIIQNALHRVRPLPQSNVEYLNYLMRHIADTKWFEILCNKSTIAHLTSEKLGALPLPLPPLDEQKAIAAFLDYKTQQIDQLIAKKEALLEKLDEKRTALISQAVTKGLDPTVPMKDSGVEWLGEIPQHWGVKRLLFLANRIGDGIHSTPQYVDMSDYYFINGNNLANGNIVINESTKCVSQDEFEKYDLHLDENTLLLSINGTIGNLAFYRNEKVMLGKSASYIMLKPNTEMKFAYYYLSSINAKNYFLNEVTGTTIFNLSLKSIKNTFFPVPLIDEQKAITRYLDQKTVEIDQQKAKIIQAINLLKEYRTALITNAVTGKIDVRSVLIPIP